MTKMDLEPVEVAGAPAPARSDRLGGFLKVGPIVLVLAIVAFGLFYWFDQRTPKAPSIVTTQIGAAEQAIRDQPNNVQARLDLGLLYHHANRLDEAITQYDQVLTVAPGHLDAHMGKGAVLQSKGDLLGATAEYAAVTTANKGREFSAVDTRLQAAYYQLGVIALQQSNGEAALGHLENALRISPTDSDALFQAARAMRLLGQNDEAVVTLRKALTFVPTEWCEPYQELKGAYEGIGKAPAASWADAMNTFCTGDSATAKQQLETLAGGDAGPDAMLGLGLIAQTEKDDAGATAWYRKVLERDPGNMAAIAALAGMGVGPDATAEPKK